LLQFIGFPYHQKPGRPNFSSFAIALQAFEEIRKSFAAIAQGLNQSIA
jgi:hypothetical protein